MTFRPLSRALTLLLLVPLAPAVTIAATIDLDWSIGTHHGTVVITQGDTVRWTWQDNFAHTVTANGGQFNSGVLVGLGTQYSFTFNAAGAFPYFCGVHGAANMDGTIQVDPPTSVESSSWGGIKALYR